MQKLVILIFTLTSTLFFAQGQDAKTDFSEIETKRIQQYNLKKGIAISWYDPLAYFTEKKELKNYKNKQI